MVDWQISKCVVRLVSCCLAGLTNWLLQVCTPATNLRA